MVASADEKMLVEEILAELKRARTKFPGDNVTTLAMAEEAGELATAAFDEPRDAVRKEAIQTAVMAMRVVLDGDATLRLWRAMRGLDPLIEGESLSGAEQIALERQRQIAIEGWTPQHDDAHRDGELAKAASCYAWMATQSDNMREVFDSPPPTWPNDWSDEWWKPKDRLADLVRAGALIAAEIDRLQRIQNADRS